MPKPISTQFAYAFYKIVVTKAQEMTLPQLRDELAHVQALSTTNCSWGEYEVRGVVEEYLKDVIRDRELPVRKLRANDPK